ncbi:MAG TPA: chemotaxis protein CheB, partial [Coleofasciculaceae cyanobacterium]
MTPRRTSKKSQPNTSDGKVPSDNQQNNPDELFPIVGIGASAGGLEAFTQLLNYLPTNTGMAFVIVQHMAPEPESALSVILGRATEMPVHEAQDGMAVAPNQVYVIPPNASMTIA